MGNITNFNKGKQAGAVSPPPSDPFALRISGKEYKYKAKIESNVESDGKIKDSSITLQKEVTSKSGKKEYVDYATSYDGGTTWVTPGSQKGGGGKPITTANSSLTAEEIKSLQPGGALNKSVKQGANVVAQKNGATPEQQKQIDQGNKSSTDPNNPSQQNGLTKEQDAQISNDIKSDGKSRDVFPGKTGDPLKYPLTLNNAHQDVIKFKMVKYRPREISNKPTSLNPLGERKGGQEIIGVVVLPIPSGISDINAVTWNGGDFDPFTAMGVDIAQSGIIKGMGGAVDSTNQAVNGVRNNTQDAQKAITNYFVQAATGASNLLSRTEGAIINPNLELLFNAPTLRPFDFMFKLSARSKLEAEAIRKIIRFFKQGMSPIRSASNLFLKAPHTFQLEYLHKGQSHTFLNVFKECALTSFSVDYTPEGQYATFQDGAMVSYQIRMQFQELEPIFNDDYSALPGRDNDTEIGY